MVISSDDVKRDSDFYSGANTDDSGADTYQGEEVGGDGVAQGTSQSGGSSGSSSSGSAAQQNFEDGSHSGFSQAKDADPYREDQVGEIRNTDDFSQTVQQEKSHSGFRGAETKATIQPSYTGFRDAESRSTTQPSHSGFRRKESNPAKEFFAEPLPNQYSRGGKKIHPQSKEGKTIRSIISRQKHEKRIDTLQKQMTSEMRNAKNWKEALAIKKRYVSIEPALGTAQRKIKNGQVTEETGIKGVGYEEPTVEETASEYIESPTLPKAELQPAPKLEPSKLELIGDDKDENWFTPFPSAYAEEAEPTPQQTTPSNPRAKRPRAHDPNTVYLNEDKQAVSVGGVPLEAKNHTDQEPTWNQRGHRAKQMIGAAPSMSRTENSITDFIEGLAAPVQNLVQGAGEFSRNVSSYAQGRRSAGQSEYEYQKWIRNEEPEKYKETLLDNLIDGKEPTRSPSYYVGSAITDVGMFVAPVPAGKGALAAKIGIASSRNSKKAQRIAQATQETGIIDDVGAASKFKSTPGKTTKTSDPVRTRIRQEIFLKKMNRVKYRNLSPKEKKIADEEFQKIAQAKETKAREAKTVKQVTPDHYIISRGTESDPAKFSTTLIDYGKGGKTKNLKNSVDRDKSPDSIDIRGDVDDTTKQMLDLFEQNNRQFVSTKTVRADEAFVLRKAEETGHLKPWADMDVYSTKDAQYLADTSLTYTKNGIPFMKPPKEIERIYQTLAVGQKPKGRSSGKQGQDIGDINYDKILVDKGLDPPKQSKRTGTKSSSKKSAEKSYWDAYEENYIESNLTHLRQAEELEKMFESTAKSSYKKKTAKTQAKVDKTSKVSTEFGVTVDSSFGTMPPALDNTLDYDISPKETGAMDMNVEVGMGQNSLQGFSQDAIEKQASDMLQDAMLDKKTPQKNSQKTKTGTGQRLTPDIVPAFDEDYIKIPGLRTGQGFDGKLTTFTPTVPPTILPPEINIPIPKIPPFISPDMLYGGSMYGYDSRFMDKYMNRMIDVKDNPFGDHNLSRSVISFGEIDDDYFEEKDKKKSKSKGKKTTSKKKSKKKEVNSWGF